MEVDRRHRTFVAAALLYGLLGLVGGMQELSVLPYPRGLAAWVDLAPLTSSTSQLGIVLVAVVLLAGFVHGRFTQASGWLLVLLAWVVAETGRSVQPTDETVSQGSQMGFAALCAYLIGRAVAQNLARDREVLGRELACGVIAAAYAMAGISKLYYGGLEWIDGRALALLIYEHAPEVSPPIQDLRIYFGTHAWLCTLSMVATLATELSGVLFLFPRLRRPFALAALSMHLGIGTMIGYYHLDWASSVLVWAWFCGPPIFTPSVVTDASPSRARTWTALALRVGVGGWSFAHGLPTLLGGPVAWTAYGKWTNAVGVYFAPLGFGAVGALLTVVGGALVAAGVAVRPLASLVALVLFVEVRRHQWEIEPFAVYGPPLVACVLAVAVAVLTRPRSAPAP